MALWIYHLFNLVLAALMYTLIGRLGLEVFLGRGNPNFILQAFVRITDPAVAAVRVLTPSAVPFLLLLVLTVVWLVIARVALALAFAASGLLDPSGAAGVL